MARIAEPYNTAATTSGRFSEGRPNPTGNGPHTAPVMLSPNFRGEEAFWQFGRDGVTASFADLYLNDPYQAYWKYVRGFSGPDTSLPLEFGLCGHKLLEWGYTQKVKLTKKDDGVNHEHYLMEEALSDVADLEAHCSNLVCSYEKLWNSQWKKQTLAQKERQQMVYGLAELVMPNYFRRWDGDLTGKYTYGTKGMVQPEEWISHEAVFDVPYTYPDGLVVRQRGRRDGVFKAQGKAWVKDSKFLGRIENANIAETLPINFQQMFYLHTYEAESGEMPKGMVLDVAKRPQERQGKASLPDFLSRVKVKWDKEEFYEENFARFKMTVSRAELINWRVTVLTKFMNEIRAWWEGKFDPCPRHNNAIGKYGRCEMFSAITRGETIGYVKRNHVFPELED